MRLNGVMLLHGKWLTSCTPGGIGARLDQHWFLSIGEYLLSCIAMHIREKLSSL
jgi:hypothetical protein